MYDLVKQGLIENMAVHQTDAFQGSFHFFFGKGLDAVRLDAGNDRTFLDDHQQIVIRAGDSYVLEKTSRVQIFNRLLRFLVIYFFPDMDGQVVIDRSRSNVLQSSYLYVFNSEGCKCPGWSRPNGRQTGNTRGKNQRRR